jgi:hypothetical protein
MACSPDESNPSRHFAGVLTLPVDRKKAENPSIPSISQGFALSDGFTSREDSIPRPASAVAAKSEGGRRLQSPGREEREIR